MTKKVDHPKFGLETIKAYFCILHVVQTRFMCRSHHRLEGTIQYGCTWEQNSASAGMLIVVLTVGYWRLHTSAKCIPVTTPRRAASLCKSSPMMVAPRSTHRSWGRGGRHGSTARLECHPREGPHCRCAGWRCSSHLEACFSSGLKVWLDVARVQVGDAHQEAGPREGPQFTETECLEGIYTFNVM